MGFVKSTDELEQIKSAQSAGTFHAENITVVCASDLGFLSGVVPKPLRVTDASFVISATRSQTNMLGDCMGIVVNVPVVHAGLDGFYTLAMYYAPEAAILWGRDLVGEPKKSAELGIHRFGPQRRAYAERCGTRIVEIEAKVDEPATSGTVTGVLYTVRSLLATDWAGFEGRVSLVATHTVAEVHEAWVGEGMVTLRSTAHDPLGDLPVHGVIAATAREATVRAPRMEAVAELDGDHYLPYYYGQHLDDWSRMTSGAQYLDWAAR